MSTEAPIQVMIVDDSAVVRQTLTAVLDREPGIRVCGTAANHGFAIERMNKNWPDVVVLDVLIPGSDGIAFLRELTGTRATPVVVCSTPPDDGGGLSLKAMSAGAAAFVAKPRTGLRTFLEGGGGEIVRAVRAAAEGERRAVLAGRRPVRVQRALGIEKSRVERLIAVGTSTGGTHALELVLASVPAQGPGMVVVQHMPAEFTPAFAARLDQISPAEVLEARDGDLIEAGRILIAPGGRHLSVERDGDRYRARVWDGPRINRHRPSVDILFDSVARSAGPHALGVIMTGMGDDGARGLLRMREAGARTIGQDEATCVVYGMPAVALKLGAVQQEVPLGAIAGVIKHFAGR